MEPFFLSGSCQISPNISGMPNISKHIRHFRHTAYNHPSGTFPWARACMAGGKRPGDKQRQRLDCRQFPLKHQQRRKQIMAPKIFLPPQIYDSPRSANQVKLILCIVSVSFFTVAGLRHEKDAGWLSDTRAGSWDQFV